MRETLYACRNAQVTATVHLSTVNFTDKQARESDNRLPQMRSTMGRSAIHPGVHLAEQLKELGMSAAELGRQLKVPTNRITGILNGQRAITGDSALRLAHFFGTSAEFWLNLQ